MYQVSNFSINVHATVGLSFFLRMYAVMLSCALMVWFLWLDFCGVKKKYDKIKATFAVVIWARVVTWMEALLLLSVHEL